MATRSLATDPSAPVPTGLREEDYRTFCAALESTQRGRDFLAEYGRRNRNADTEMLLDSLDRIEGMMQSEGKARDRLRDELRVLLIAIRLARPDINSATALTKAARLVDLLDLMERRIDAMVENKDLPPLAEEPMPAQAPLALTVVPVPDEPELPIPAITSLQGPVIALVQEPTRVVITPLPMELPPQELTAQEPPKAEAAEAPEPEPAAPELAPHEWAQLEILNQPRPKADTAAEPYEIWDSVAEAAPEATVAVIEPEPVTASEPVVAAAPEPAPMPTEKWLPDFAGEAQIIHTKPVTAAAFMPEVTFMAPARGVTIEAKVEMKAETSEAADTAVAPPAGTTSLRAVVPRADPLAPIMALSEAERIALFT